MIYGTFLFLTFQSCTHLAPNFINQPPPLLVPSYGSKQNLSGARSTLNAPLSGRFSALGVSSREKSDFPPTKRLLSSEQTVPLQGAFRSLAFGSADFVNLFYQYSLYRSGLIPEKTLNQNWTIGQLDKKFFLCRSQDKERNN